MKPIISIIVTISVVVGLVTLMNLGLHYGQELWHKEDQERLDVLKEEIQSLRARMDTLHGVIEIVESPSQSDVDRYNEMVGVCNEKIEEANLLAEKVGTKYRIGVGGRGRR